MIKQAQVERQLYQGLVSLALNCACVRAHPASTSGWPDRLDMLLMGHALNCACVGAHAAGSKLEPDSLGTAELVSSRAHQDRGSS